MLKINSDVIRSVIRSTVTVLEDWRGNTDQQDIYTLLLRLSGIEGDTTFAQYMNEIRKAYKRQMKEE